MNKKILILLTLFILPNIVKAECSNQEIIRYKNIATNVNNYIEFNESSKTFDLTIYNVTNDIYITINDNKYYRNDQNEIKINNLTPGIRYPIKIKPLNGMCQDYSVRTIYVNTPSYNKYYNLDICKDNNNSLCSKWANTNGYTEEQFKNILKEKEKEEEQTIIEQAENIKKYTISDFLRDYYIIILLTIIVLGIYSIYKLDKKQKFDF